jgi:glycosyltransferase involved in cell wall biosynthesis
MASAYESFCLAALESMACGVPVIATRVGGLPEVVIHGRTGFLYNPGETETAAEYASSLLGNADLYSFISKNARERALRFEQQSVVDLYEAFYSWSLPGESEQGGYTCLLSASR